MPHNDSTRGMSAIPFKAPAIFQQFGIDWTRAAATEPERSLREAFLTHETSCGPNGLVSVLLLATVSRRQGAVAEDLQAAADYADEVLLLTKLRKHQHDALEAAYAYLRDGGVLWS